MAARNRRRELVLAQVLHEEWFTPVDGWISWQNAPAEGIHINVSADGFESKNDLPLASDTPQEIVMSQPTTIRGDVVDAETGQTIPQFSLLLGAGGTTGTAFDLAAGCPPTKRPRKSPGSFESMLTYPCHEWVMRVESRGYLAEDSERFPYDGSHHALTFRLTKAEPIRGVVRNPDGSPAADSVVYLVAAEDEDTIDYLSLINGEVREYDRDRAIHRPGCRRRAIRAATAETRLYACCPIRHGLRITRRGDAGRDGVLRLQPWARINRTVTLAGKPAAKLAISAYDPTVHFPLQGNLVLNADCTLRPMPKDALNSAVLCRAE